MAALVALAIGRCEGNMGAALNSLALCDAGSRPPSDNGEWRLASSRGRSSGPRRLRLAVLGDSWVTSWEEVRDEGWHLMSPLPKGLRDGLDELGCWRCVELIVAGFPGSTAGRLLDLARLVRLREMSMLVDRFSGKLPWRGDLSKMVARFGVLADQQGLPVREDVDAVVLVAGWNDLRYGISGPEAAGRLLELRRLYRARGLEAIPLSIGRGLSAPRDLEARRTHANTQLVMTGLAVNTDALLEDLRPHAWKDSGHLTCASAEKVGRRLAGAVSARLVGEGAKPPIRW